MCQTCFTYFRWTYLVVIIATSFGCDNSNRPPLPAKTLPRVMLPDMDLSRALTQGTLEQRLPVNSEVAFYVRIRGGAEQLKATPVLTFQISRAAKGKQLATGYLFLDDEATKGGMPVFAGSVPAVHENGPVTITLSAARGGGQETQKVAEFQAKYE